MKSKETVAKVVANDLYDHLKALLESPGPAAADEARKALQRAASLGIAGTGAYAPKDRRP